MKVWILFAGAIAALVLGFSAAAFYTTQNGQTYSSPSCSALGIGWNSVRHDSGLTHLCGVGTVSDGRLVMALHNYHFAQIGSNIFLLANLTFANIGRGNTSIANVLYANITNGAVFVGNGGGGADTEFPGQYPNRTLPDASGGVFLPPGKSITYWLPVYVPNTGTKDIPNLKLNDLSFVESIYGGIWEGGGAFRCPCGNLFIDLIVVTSASTPNTTLTASPPTTTITYTKSSTSFISQGTFTNGQPLVEVTNTSLPSSIPSTGRSNISISCQRPASGTYGTIVVANQGTGSASLKVLVVQYSALSSMGGYATATLTGKGCSFLPANSVATLYVTGLPAAGRIGSYYDGWAVLTSGAETNVFSGQFA